MYLYRETYTQRWDHQSPEEKFEVTVKKGGVNFDAINSEKISSVRENIGYWRKFNALHNFIIQTFAEGKDDCSDVYLDEDALILIYNTVKEVSINHSKAEELLPTTEGFFFGGTDYDEWYFKNIEETLTILRPYIDPQNNYHFDFYYRASW